MSPEQNEPPQRTLLLVTDEERSFTLASTLCRAEWEIHPFLKGKEAYRFLMGNPMDVVIVTESLPDMTGLMFAKVIRTGLETKSMGTIFLHDPSNQPDRESLMDNGINMVLPWSTDSDHLHEAVGNLMEVAYRANARLLVQAQIQSKFKGSNILCNSVNISHTGILVTTSKKLPKGTRLLLHVSLPGVKEKFQAEAEVARDAGEVDTQWHAFGMRFVGVDPAHQKVLDSFLDNLKPENSN